MYYVLTAVQRSRTNNHLQWGCTQLMAPPTLRNFREVVDQSLKYVSSIQITIIVHIDVHHTLGIWGRNMGQKQRVNTLTGNKKVANCY